MKYFFIILVLMNFVACKDSESSKAPIERKKVEEIKDALLDGVVNNANWAFVSGRVKPSPFRDNEYSLDLWDFNSSDPCNEWGTADSRKIVASIPNTVGNFDFGNERNVTFSFNENGSSVNYVATEGSLVITKIEGEYLEAKMIANFDPQNNVNGSFKVQICQ